MPRTCTVCAHPKREEIDKALAAGVSAAEISGRYRTIGERAVRRHKANHLPARVAKAQEVEDVREALDVINQLKAINAASLHILKEAREQGKQGTALAAIDRIHKQIELQAKLLGELDDSPVVNIVLSAEWIQVRTVLLSALSPYPEARSAVAGGLLELGAG